MSSAPAFVLSDPGTEFPINYPKYGVFSGVGTHQYKYRITDRDGLAKAAGMGIFPSNGAALTKDPGYQKWMQTKPKTLNVWDYVQTGDPQAEFYVWATGNSVGPGTKLFFTAQALAEAGLYQQALKAYYGVLVHFPKEPCWSADNTFVWYIAGEALSRIETITKHQPEIGYRLKGAVFKVENGKDTNLNNDRFVIDPGQWVKHQSGKSVNLTSMKIAQRRGTGKVQVVQFDNKQWQLRVDNQPMVVRGLTYNPTKVGRNIEGTRGSLWMHEDLNGNGRIDTAYDSFVDKNGNNQQDRNEKAVGDFQLMEEMGANAIRLYRFHNGRSYNPKEFNKPLLRKMVAHYGIYAIMSDFLGAYTVGSGANWEEGTDYTDAEQLSSMRTQIRDYVNDHKDEPYVLMWLLGNENLMDADYSGVNATRTKASEQVSAYLTFVNEIAAMIHELDPNHPVAVGNFDLAFLEEHNRFAPHVDIFGANSYRGATGFGSLWSKVQASFDRPVLITEFGCDAYNSQIQKEDEQSQAKYHDGAWTDIALNMAGKGEEGNSIGGIVFEFLDEWWKSHQGAQTEHDATKDSPMAFPDGWSSEEWLGLVSQGNGSQSPLLRKPRRAYYLYKDKLWKKEAS